MKLLQDFLQLFRDRQSQMGRVLQNAETLIGQVEENDCGSQHSTLAEDIDIHNVPMPTRVKISTLRQMPLKPMELERFLTVMRT